MGKVSEIDVYMDVADETEAAAAVSSAIGSQLPGYPEMACKSAAIERMPPVAQSHYELNADGTVRLDANGQPILDPLRDDKGAHVMQIAGPGALPKPMMKPPRPGKIRVRLNYK